MRMTPILFALLALLIFSALWSFTSFLNDVHKERLREHQQQIEKDLSLKRPTTDAWRRHAGLD